MDHQPVRTALDRRGFLLRSAALVVAAATAACQHTAGGPTDDAEEYDSRQISPPAPGGGMGGGDGANLCLLPGSLVIDGSYHLRLVEDIGIGETVTSLDSRTGRDMTTVVTGVLRDHVRDHFYVVNDELRITNDHPVLVRTARAPYWTRVEDLTIGDRFHSPAGEIAARSIRRIDHSAQTVNLETAAESFLVAGSDGPYVVHGRYRGQRLQTLARAA